MRGSVFPHKGGWAVRYDAGCREDGSRVQPFKSGFATRAEAEAYLTTMLAAVITGRHVAPTRKTFGDYARYWLEVVMPGAVRATSYERYRTQVALHLIPAFGSMRLDALAPGHLHRQYRRWEAADLAARTIRALHARMFQILRSAVGEGLLAANVMDRVEQPDADDAEMQTWTEAELDHFLAHCLAEQHGALWHVYAVTGMRRGEALGLRWRDVDWRGRELHVRQQAQYLDHAVRLVPPKTKASRRSVGVGAETMAILEARRREYAEAKLGAGPAWRDHDLVFAHIPVRRRGQSRPGDPWLPDNVTKTWRLVVARSGLPAIRLHDLRHTHATIMLRVDGNVKAIAARLGHSPAVLLKTYAHVAPADQQRAVARFEAALRASRTPGERGGADVH